MTKLLPIEIDQATRMIGWDKVLEQRKILIDYTNNRNERAVRTILPYGMIWGETEWHPGEQYLLEALDVEKDSLRTFAVKDIHQWGAKPGPAGQTIDGMIAAQLKRSMERNARMSNRLRLLSERALPMNVNDFRAAVGSILRDEDPA